MCSTGALWWPGPGVSTTPGISRSSLWIVKKENKKTMDTLLEVEEHPLPPDTWGEAPQSPFFRMDDRSPTSQAHTTLPPAIHPE
jgi:hypothetical protein